MKTVLMISLLAALVGCSAKKSSVENVPPHIEKPELKSLAFGVELGTLKPEFISILLWPTSWTEKETEDRVYTINKYSKFLDEILIEKMSLQPKIDGVFAQFNADQCVARFRRAAAEGETLPDPASYLETDDVEWAPVETIAETDRPAFAGCLKNQAQRAALHDRDNEILHYMGTDDEATALRSCSIAYGPNPAVEALISTSLSLPIVSMTIDCALGPNNKVAVGNEGSLLKFTNSPAGRAVDISFGNFNGAGDRANQSTMKAADVKKKADLKVSLAKLRDEAGTLSGDALTAKNAEIATAVDGMKRFAKFIREASIDPDGRHLQFVVPDMTSELVARGDEFVYVKEFAFDYYRVDNLAPTIEMKGDDGSVTPIDIAKFKGDVSVRVNGVEIQKGSGQIMGKFMGAPRQ